MLKGLLFSKHADILCKRQGVPMRQVAIFDFDHTLITGDSFWPYLSYVAGKACAYGALADGLAQLGIARAQATTPVEARSFLKAHLLRRLLAGRKIEDLHHAAEKTRLWQMEIAPVTKALRRHKESGAVIVIASGGLDLYLPALLRDLPYDALICTDIGVENGLVTGAMINGNCVRDRKAERVAQWLATQEPFEESWGYGNYPHDLPMMNLVQRRIIVS